MHAVVHVCFGLWHETDSPCTLYLSTGNQALWLRYAEWLLTCPVILIHLSNLTGMKNDYNKRTMALLVSDVGCIVWGTTAALSTDFIKVSTLPTSIFRRTCAEDQAADKRLRIRRPIRG
jgi:hypothetical protein